MERNILLAGVGGQGILTIAEAISRAALRRGLTVKQSEVHGMSQRGGAVQSHLRWADHELFSDLIVRGRCDLVLAVEPLEALRYVEYLGHGGSIVASTTPFVNISNYPPIEEVLDRIAQCGDHVLIDAERLARAAGSVRAANVVMLGAAAALLELDAAELEASIAAMFEAKGAAVVAANCRALRLGMRASAAYRDGLRLGGAPREVRRWVDSLSAEALLAEASPRPDWSDRPAGEDDLSAAESRAVEQVLEYVRADGRDRLFEHEVYSLVEVSGAIQPPRHVYFTHGETVTFDRLRPLRGERVAVKLVSPDIVHKTEARAVAFVPNDPDAVTRTIAELAAPHLERGRRISGALVVEFVESAGAGFGAELFVGIRATREFGPVIAAGLGGVDTEYLASRMRPGVAVAKALAADTTAEQFFELFQKTAAYDVLAGRVRGHERAVGDGELMRCFRAFLGIARRFCIERDEPAPRLLELEVNPFAFAHQRLVPLDGRGRLTALDKPAAARPFRKIDALLTPRSIAILGVSAKRENFGRIILRNTLQCGFPPARLYVIKDQAEPIDGVACWPSLGALPEPVDLLVAAVGAEDVPALIDDVIARRRATSVILIPGGLGEKEGTEGVQERLRSAILATRRQPDGGPIFLGGNCLGVRSAPGRYDTFFIPSGKLDPRRDARPQRLALISQSGAFIVSRMSTLDSLNPALAVSIGNQLDLTVSDVLNAIGQRDDIDTIGIYVEGFKDLDGLAFMRAVQSAAAAGKTVVFYKAGRTPAGRSATAGHTASVAGDYDVCQAAAAQAGAIVVDTFKEFEQLVELSVALHGKSVPGRRIGAISNAGYESVGMADTLLGARYEVEMPPLSDATRRRLAACLAEHGLADLVNVRNPLDLTPMADDATYEHCAGVFLEAEELDAVVVGCVPLTARLLTTPEEIGQEGSLPRRMSRLFRETTKPMVAVIDSGARYDAMARAMSASGMPVLRSADQAVRSLGRYLCHRATAAVPREASPAAEPVQA